MLSATEVANSLSCHRDRHPRQTFGILVFTAQAPEVVRLVPQSFRPTVFARDDGTPSAFYRPFQRA
jgi:hypothetical protein